MQIFVNGLLQGCLIGGVGVAFALVYRTARVFHLALGGIYALSPFVMLAVFLFFRPQGIFARAIRLEAA